MTVLSALASHYDRLVARDEAPPFGYSEERISYTIVLSRDGTPVDVLSLLDTSGKKPRPVRLVVPQPVVRRSNILANFLWDKTAYALGVTATPRDRTAEEHSTFVHLHRERLSGIEDEGLSALLRFLDTWVPERFAQAPFMPEMLDANIVFRLDGEKRYLHERAVARALWSRLLADRSGDATRCLVTGESAPLARLHSPIKGVRGAKTAGAALVSFNLSAFESYGKSQGDNAPVSEQAAFAYTTALNCMLQRDSRHKMQVGDSTVVFWAQGDAGAGVAELAEALFAGMTNPPGPDDDQASAEVRSVLAQMAAGRPLPEDAARLQHLRFHILGLSPNAARLSVRFWHVSTFGELANRFQRYWQDLRIEPTPWKTAPAICRLLYETALQRKAESVPPLLGGELMRAILGGGRFPGALLNAVVVRLRADHAVNGLRAAICKACLVRAGEEVPVSLDLDEPNAAYRLGRLFAVLESVQRAALGKVNATIRDRYYAAASAAPAAVFPMLLRTTGHHLASLRKTDKGGLAGWFERDIGDIIGGIGTSLPPSLRIEDQGRFAIGYYHQRYARRADAPAEVAVAEADSAQSEGED